MARGSVLFTALLLGPVLAAIQYLIWYYAPVEATLGVIQKIFYFHLPMAWWSMLSFFLVFIASIGFLIKRTMFWDRLAGVAAEIGLLFSTLALITGTFWARGSWNVWWTWDPRLTTTLIMWFVYAAYLILRSLDMAPERRGLVSAVIGIVAFLDVPLVFYSARMWRSIHPAVFRSGGGLEPEMKTTVIASILAFSLVWLSLLLLRLEQTRLQHKLDAATLDIQSDGETL